MEQRHASEARTPRLDVVLKADAAGTLEAATAALGRADLGGAELRVIERAIGDVTKSDLLMATTGSRLVLGYQVGARPKVEEEARGHGVEIRLYSVIYRLVRDVEEIAVQLLPRMEEETVLGKSHVIALFKSTRKGIILGCEVTEGKLVKGKRFRVITAAGVVHEGTIDSLHIEQSAVEEVRAGRNAGVKVEGFNKARIGDLVECFEPPRGARHAVWAPSPGLHRVDA